MIRLLSLGQASVPMIEYMFYFVKEIGWGQRVLNLPHYTLRQTAIHGIQEQGLKALPVGAHRHLYDDPALTL